MADAYPVIPEIPHDVPDYQLQILDAVKEAIEVLTGQRGTGNLRPVTKGEITIRPNIEEGYVVKARNIGVSISGQQVAPASEFVTLTNDVQALANRVDALQRLVNTLILQLRDTPR